MTEKWYLKKESGVTYGPATMNVLQGWAAENRIGPQDDVSQDQQHWQPAPLLNELEMVWSLRLDEDHIYGPFNVLALPELVEEHHLGYATEVIHLRSGKVHAVGDVLIPVLVASLDRAKEAMNRSTDSFLSNPVAERENLRLIAEVDALKQDILDLEQLLERKRQEQTHLSEKAMADHQCIVSEREKFSRTLKRMEDELNTAAEYIKQLESEKSAHEAASDLFTEDTSSSESKNEAHDEHPEPRRAAL